MKDPLYGKGSGSGTIRKDEGFNFTKYIPERLKKKSPEFKTNEKRWLFKSVRLIFFIYICNVIIHLCLVL